MAGPKKSIQERLAAARQARALRSQQGQKVGRTSNQIPESIMEDVELSAAINNSLPLNYDFQIKKTIWQVQKNEAKFIALQMPEGLLIYSCVIIDILKAFCPTIEDSVILGDVTYGACCIDDFTAKSLGADFLIHYGHSCLIPIDVTKKNINIMYIFVDIKFDHKNLVESIKLTQEITKTGTLFLFGTIQFASSLFRVSESLVSEGYSVSIPQEKPLSKGEVLGCTSPRLDTSPDDTMIFVADGRFHMESAMISNPLLNAFRYDPYNHKLINERYDSELLKSNRSAVIAKVQCNINTTVFCLIQGTLGRQGNPGIVGRIEKELKERGLKYFVCLISEANPAKLKLFEKEVDCFIQVCCPRLSIDWGESYHKPMLTSYEFFVLMKKTEFKDIYPQDFYSKSAGPWGNYYQEK